MFKRLVVIVVGALVAASFGIPSAAAEDPNGSFTMTVNKKALTNQFKTLITVSGTYSCSAINWTPNPDISGINVNVTQIQGARTIVTGGGGNGGLTCDGETHPWSLEVQAMSGSGPFGGTPATWKAGKVAASIGGNASDGWCDESGCYDQINSIGTNLEKVLQIS